MPLPAPPAQFSDKPRPPITMDPVESSQIAAIGYDPATKTLAVQFKHGAGAIYHYPNFEPETFEALRAAESPGKFFGQHIKGLPFEKYAPEPKADEPKTSLE